MKFHYFNIVPALLILAITSCTHEYEPNIENNWRLDVDLAFTDAGFWPEGQQMRIGVFGTASDKEPVSSVIVNQPEEGSTTVSLSQVPGGNYSLQLYLTENGVYKVIVADLGTIALTDNLQVETGPITLLTYSRIQNQIFNKCQLCHGGSSGDVAAELNLTAAKSYEQLVNVQAFMNPSMTRVIPGSANYSYLVKVLNKEIAFEHVASSSITPADKQLIIDWINEGAANNQ